MPSLARKIVRRLRGQPTMAEQLTSTGLRQNFAAKGVEVGLYSYGCFDLNRVPAGVSIGRYCSFAPTSQVFLRNHGIGFLGLTAYLYNETLGVVDETTIESATLKVGDDVWVGHNATILPSVGEIGRGAVIAAGAVVTKPVPAYAIVAGNPARVVRMRFTDDIIAAIEETRWWEKDTDELRALVKERPELVFDPAAYFSRSSASLDTPSKNTDG